MTKPLDEFWILTDNQGAKRVAYVAVAYARQHHNSDGSIFTAISPTFDTPDQVATHIRALITDLEGALAMVDRLDF